MDRATNFAAAGIVLPLTYEGDGTLIDAAGTVACQIDPNCEMDDDRVASIASAIMAAVNTAQVAPQCKASPDHADIMETIESASDDWQKSGYASALAEVRDMANVGRALMEALPDGYSYMNCPSEIVSDLQNERDEALATSSAQVASAPDRVKNWRVCEDATCDGNPCIAADAVSESGLERTPAQFFFEIGYGACWAEAFVRNGQVPPFPLTEQVIERAWAIAGEAHDDHEEFDRYLARASSAEESGQ